MLRAQLHRQVCVYKICAVAGLWRSRELHPGNPLQAGTDGSVALRSGRATAEIGFHAVSIRRESGAMPCPDWSSGGLDSRIPLRRMPGVSRVLRLSPRARGINEVSIRPPKLAESRQRRCGSSRRHDEARISDVSPERRHVGGAESACFACKIACWRYRCRSCVSADLG
jgi:hypothetical protein